MLFLLKTDSQYSRSKTNVSFDAPLVRRKRQTDGQSPTKQDISKTTTKSNGIPSHHHEDVNIHFIFNRYQHLN